MLEKKMKKYIHFPTQNLPFSLFPSVWAGGQAAVTATTVWTSAATDPLTPACLTNDGVAKPLLRDCRSRISGGA